MNKGYQKVLASPLAAPLPRLYRHRATAFPLAMVMGYMPPEGSPAEWQIYLEFPAIVDERKKAGMGTIMA
ncbi:MAG: hypothetical protein LBH97_02340 [Treponema sp.]|nr:hypothetical protein [Treponema sp.]